MADNPFFKEYAEGYAKSKSHASGSDLFRLVSIVKKNSNLCLDIATGTGFTAAELSKRCRKVVAIDETENMIRKAVELMNQLKIKNVEFIKSNLENFETADKYDVITIRRALHHFQNKDLFFKKCHTLLKDDGVLIIADMISPEEDTEDNFNKLERIRDPTHVGALKLSEYYEFAEKYGYSIRYEDTVIEDLGFEEWLYPVPLSSDTGKNCLEFISQLSDDQLANMHYDRNKMVLSKHRVIIALSKKGI
ncbi:MAG: methyltransferase domain-containing protein [Nitrososphaerota archaeon]|jgi:SAM-dependent methyltransferase|nr:methyltransferase domain-containing protein [Nitrososphaerota archaeon]MDG6927284.1 methyltransferase domain-containing protein [Nitrososphaerota archaeon]MDG6930358.1 methyltransferase domain-containing protein [Nitrososphaerota archaeon]MDG6931714.1 methyltransferase domain-containing protein [Nitrososphaerota archaeon]MDG6936762.1 methyltransferase domain-containing protein [Nitrososphaerota archaeon]